MCGGLVGWTGGFPLSNHLGQEMDPCRVVQGRNQSFTDAGSPNSAHRFSTLNSICYWQAGSKRPLKSILFTLVLFRTRFRQMNSQGLLVPVQLEHGVFWATPSLATILERITKQQRIQRARTLHRHQINLPLK